MSPTTVIWSIIAGICLTLAAVHFLIWFQERAARMNLAFAMWTSATAVTALMELAMMQARSVGQYGELMRWIHLPLAVATFFYLWFIILYLQAGRRWLQLLIYGVVVLRLVINFSSVPNFNFSEITALQYIPLWGESVASPIGVQSRWQWIDEVSWIVMILFIADAVVGAWRGGRRRQAIVMGTCVVMTSVLSTWLAWMMVRGTPSFPWTVSLPSLLIIMVMAYELSGDLLRSARISEALRKNQERMRLAAKAVNLGIWEWDIAKGEFWASEEGRARVGVSRNETITVERFLQSVHPDDRERVRTDMQRVAEGMQEPKIEYRVTVKDGAARWIASHGLAERDSKGRVVRVRGINVDSTALVSTTNALREAIARYRAMIDAFDGYIYICSQDYRIEFMNQRLIERTGRNGVGEFCYHVLHGKDSVCEWCVNDRVFKGETVRWEAQSPKDDRWYDVVNTPIHHADGAMSKQAMIQDITDRKQAEAERIQLRFELAHLNRVLTLNELSSSLAHEINQPLGAILNNAAAAKIVHTRSHGGGGEVGEILDEIMADGNRAGQIVRKIRGIIKKEEERSEPNDMNRLIREVIGLFRNPIAREKIVVREELSSGLPPVRGDRVRLQQVVMNLIMNATDAMKKSQNRVLTIRSAMQDTDRVSVSISDTGPGIDEKIKDRLFSPFATTKKEGLGMGLRICRTILEDHGGSIRAENKAEGGATFSFTLKIDDGGKG